MLFLLLSIACTFPGGQDTPLMPEPWALSSLKMGKAQDTAWDLD